MLIYLYVYIMILKQEFVDKQILVSEYFVVFNKE